MEGGHNIPKSTIVRRYKRGLSNFFKLYRGIVDNWMFIDNSGSSYQLIAEGNNNLELVFLKEHWSKIKLEYEKENI